MKDRPSDDARHWLFGPGQAIPADSERATAWQREFSSGGAFRSAFEHASIGMAIVDLDGRFLKVNRSLCEIVGYRENELLARTFQDITHPDDLEADLMMARRLVAGDIDVQHLEKRYVHSDAHAVWIDGLEKLAGGGVVAGAGESISAEVCLDDAAREVCF